MTKFLYGSFLENKRVYNLAQGAWSRLLTSLLKDYGYTHSPYINQSQNGVKEYDGNPIFSAFIPEIKRAIRIIQVSPEEEGSDISAWFDTIELEGDLEKTDELVVDVKLSQDSKNIAENLIQKWITEQLDEAVLDDILESKKLV